MATKRTGDNISREEDFRDDDSRNIDQGWPYADQSGGASDPAENAAYGNPNASFDGASNKGYTVDKVDADGQEEPIKDSATPGTYGLEDADDLEERITNALDDLDIIEMDLIDVHVEEGSVTVEGVVDEAVTARQIVRAIQGVKGVRSVTNNIRAAGVDSRIPDED